MISDTVIAALEQKYQALSRLMDERLRWRWAAIEARALGWGGVTAVTSATGLSGTTIRRGLAELESEVVEALEEAGRIRQPGGGRRALVHLHSKNVRYDKLLFRVYFEDEDDASKKVSCHVK